MNINIWGPACWSLLHTLAEKIKDDHFPIIGKQLFSQIILICHNLPCPDCSGHAKQFLSKIDPSQMKTKNDLKNLLYVFHNTVSSNKQKQLYRYENLDNYRNSNLINAFNVFSTTYNTNGTLTMMSDNFHRQQVVSGIKRWLMQNLNHFDM